MFEETDLVTFMHLHYTKGTINIIVVLKHLYLLGCNKKEEGSREERGHSIIETERNAPFCPFNKNLKVVYIIIKKLYNKTGSVINRAGSSIITQGCVKLNGTESLMILYLCMRLD